MVERAQQTADEPLGGADTAAAADDSGAVAVGEACKLLEGLLLFLSGAADSATLLGFVARFVGPLRQLARPDGELLPPSDAGTESSGFAAATPSWASVADTLVQHLMARLTFPVPPADGTTVRLVMGAALACVAEFVRSLPAGDADAARARFRRVFAAGLLLLSSPAAAAVETTAAAATLPDGVQSAARGDDATLSMLGAAMKIAQQLRSLGLDSVDVAGGGGALSVSQVRVRRRSQVPAGLSLSGGPA